MINRMEIDGMPLRKCQAERCSLPASVLPWPFDCCVMTIELWLCHRHGELIDQAKVTFGDEEAA